MVPAAAGAGDGFEAVGVDDGEGVEPGAEIGAFFEGVGGGGGGKVHSFVARIEG